MAIATFASRRGALSLTDKTRMPSPQTPLPERARGFENLQLFLAPLLLLWEKGLGDEGKRFVSQSGGALVPLSGK
jgi:hypothetical protein